MKGLFIKFLCEHDAYFAFMEAFTTVQWCKGSQYKRGFTLDAYIKHTEARSLLMDCFVWGSTKEKFDYWDTLDDEWRVYLAINKK